MSSTGTVTLSEVFDMLEECAPGHTKAEKTHHWCVFFGTKTYPRLPKGPHGRGNSSAIQVGHVKHMARVLEILPCARRTLGLR